jgi:hypothetical protein
MRIFSLLKFVFVNVKNYILNRYFHLTGIIYGFGLLLRALNIIGNKYRDGNVH